MIPTDHDDDSHRAFLVLTKMARMWSIQVHGGSKRMEKIYANTGALQYGV